jgi:hypothetical protein
VGQEPGGSAVAQDVQQRVGDVFRAGAQDEPGPQAALQLLLLVVQAAQKPLVALEEIGRERRVGGT